MSLLSVKKLCAGYGKKEIVKDISFDISSGEIVGILGANGSGKSTLLKAVCNIIDYDGQCVINDREVKNSGVKEIARVCSYMPQRSGISIDISVLDVVLMGFNPYLGVLSYPDETMVNKAVEVLNEVGLAGKEHENYMTLSEGQKQLCVLARCMVTQASLLLMDEPDNSLDFRIRHKLMGYIKEWVSDGSRSVLMAVHDVGIALNYFDRLLLIEDGKMVCEISPRTEDIALMEEKLSLIYGNIGLVECKNKMGEKQLMMIKEADDR